jgi:hypothetical protein
MAVTEAMFFALKDDVIELKQDRAVSNEVNRSIVSRLDKIETILMRLTWAIILAVIAAVLGQVLINAGVHVPVP